jgi:hypothetical protein
MFFGREDDFTFIKQKVTGGKKGGLLVLCGSRRSGKTSILFQIMNRRLGDEFFPVLIDMQAMAVESDLDFLIKLAQGIIEAIGDPTISLEEDFLAYRGDGSLDAFGRLIVKVNKKLGEKKLVLLFDEYEIFESLVAKKLLSADILNLFANWIEHKEGVFVVFTGSDKLEERKAGYWGHFLGKALHRRISFLSKSDTLRLIRDPLRDVIRYEEGMPEEIYRLTAGQPFFTQVFCQALVDHLNEVQAYDLADKDLHDVIDQIIENPLPQMIFSWNSLSHLEKLTLSIVGELNRDSVKPVGASDILSFCRRERVGYQIDSNALNETLERLFYHDMLDKDSRGRYTFKMDLWRRWMARMHSIWQVVDEIKSGEGVLGEGIKPVPRGFNRTLVLGAVAGMVAIVGMVLVYTKLTSGDDRPIAVVGGVDSTRLTIRTTPDNADVFLGDNIIGKTPIENSMVASGITPLRIELPGYEDVVGTLRLEKDGFVDTLITLAARTGDLDLQTTPSGASVYVNNERTDRVTPATFENLPVNQRYDVRLTKKGYDTREIRGLQIYDDTLITVHRTLFQSTQAVHVESRPEDGATIYVDDTSLGETPRMCTLTHGVHRLELRKEGYRETSQDITVPVVGGRVQVTLSRLPPGTLIVKVTPYADIYVNGDFKEQDSRYEDDSLDPGRYSIRLEHPDLGAMTKIVYIKSGEVTEVSHDFAAGGEQQ